MFVKTVKIKKPKLIAVGVGILALLLIAILFAIGSKACKSSEYSIGSEDERQSFMNEMGWDVSDKYSTCKVITIPSEFNDVYNKYNDLQQQQGFNLADYKGKTVEIYSYEVYNYPDKPDNIVCNLMIYDGKLIGGDVSSVELSGFMQGLKK